MKYSLDELLKQDKANPNANELKKIIDNNFYKNYSQSTNSYYLCRTGYAYAYEYASRL